MEGLLKLLCHLWSNKAAAIVHFYYFVIFFSATDVALKYNSKIALKESEISIIIVDVHINTNETYYHFTFK